MCERGPAAGGQPRACPGYFDIDPRLYIKLIPGWRLAGWPWSWVGRSATIDNEAPGRPLCPNTPARASLIEMDLDRSCLPYAVISFRGSSFPVGGASVAVAAVRACRCGARLPIVASGSRNNSATGHPGRPPLCVCDAPPGRPAPPRSSASGLCGFPAGRGARGARGHLPSLPPKVIGPSPRQSKAMFGRSRASS